MPSDRSPRTGSDKVKEVIRWLDETGQRPCDAVDFFWPELSHRTRLRMMEKVRSWYYTARRARKDAGLPERVEPAASPLSIDDGDEEGAGSGAPIVPDDNAPDMAPDAYYADLVAKVAAALTRAGEVGALRLIPQLAAKAIDARERLDEARKATSSKPKVSRSPRQLADDIAALTRKVESASR